jgi:hypothetical protein
MWNLSGIAILVGYIYVVLTNTIALFLKWCGVLEDTNPVTGE